jgi:hypothetical protein
MLSVAFCPAHLTQALVDATHTQQQRATASDTGAVKEETQLSDTSCQPCMQWQNPAGLGPSYFAEECKSLSRPLGLVYVDHLSFAERWATPFTTYSIASYQQGAACVSHPKGSDECILSLPHTTTSIFKVTTNKSLTTMMRKKFLAYMTPRHKQA